MDVSHCKKRKEGREGGKEWKRREGMGWMRWDGMGFYSAALAEVELAI